MEPFDGDYYARNCQDRDRPALGFYQRLASRFFTKGEVLDFGCGCGFFLKRLNRSFQGHGLELSEHGRCRTRQLNPASPVYATSDQLPTACFSGVTALHVFEHIDDRQLEEILACLHRSLKDNGRMLCVMPQREGRGHRLKGDGWAGFRDRTHINLKTAKEWTDFFGRNRFCVVQAGTDGLWDFPYTSLPRILEFCIYASGTVFQFLLGRLILPVTAGESVVLLLQKLPCQPRGADNDAIEDRSV